MSTSQENAVSAVRRGKLIPWAALLGLVAVLTGGYFLRESQQQAADQAATAQLKQLGVTVVRNPNTNRTQSVNLRLITDPAKFAEVWPIVLQLPGVQSLDFTECPITHEQFAQLATNRSITSLQASSVHLTDADVANLVNLPIGALHVGSNDISATGLKSIGRIRTLSVLTLSENPQVGSDLSGLGQLPKLEWLLLNKNNVSDDALAQLAGIKSLKRLSLQGSTVNPAAVEKLKNDIPGLAVDL